ncbi:MAG TPA: flagellar biosynthesis anti-sigma factor FlgM [Phycisphaerales bacterium]|jgi:anti-sigma28 factor (negative regulator of flagellin synthesis)|nr:flagellar biosynthesis anti-sigma factor FlgM [Phycisphaerales bacterium]
MTPISFNPAITSTIALRPGEDSAARQVEPKSYTPPARAADQVELSDAARQAAADPSSIRYDLVSKVREQIASGTYETPGRTAVAIDEMTRALRAG